MTMATLLEKCPQGISITRINGKWRTEIRGKYSVRKITTKSFPTQQLILGLIDTQAEYAFAS